jgi:hypothetical protein
VVRNNLATEIVIKGNQGVVADHNLIIKKPAKLFVDAPAYDLHLKKTARAVDTGSSDLAPDIDHDQVSRPWGEGYDIGAYEYHEGEVGIDSQGRKETETRENPKVDEDPSAAQRQQAPEDRATSVPLETDSEEQSNAQSQPASAWSSTTTAWLLAAAAVSVLSVVWLARR